MRRVSPPDYGNPFHLAHRAGGNDEKADVISSHEALLSRTGGTVYVCPVILIRSHGYETLIILRRADLIEVIFTAELGVPVLSDKAHQQAPDDLIGTGALL